MSEVMSQNDDCYINNSKYSNVDKVIELIDRDNLTKKDRRRVFIHRRAFMCAVLRKEGLSLKNIADLIDRNHATVINALKNYRHWARHNDDMFHDDVSEYLDIFGYKKIETVKHRSILEDIENCRNMQELTMIKRRILNGVY